MSSNKVYFFVENSLCTPDRGTPGSAGIDLRNLDPVHILPGKRVCVSVGVRIVLPKGTYARIAPKSGLALRLGLDVLAGVIDSDYGML